jgi:glucosamine--fructose-6-phosphate aminotransferase (isomerizing)
MCGIFGCAARRDVAERIVEALRHLEYRGYDSAGVAVIEGDRLRVMRREGRIDHLAADVARERPGGDTGIGHTRWATHGEPSERNAHPHRDGSGNLALIHNGIVENHEVLRERLKGLGHVFESETDSEVLPHLIEEHQKAGLDLTQAVIATIAEVRGTYAFVVIDRRLAGTLVAARKDSPLVVGVGEGENFVASDVSALLASTRDVVYLGNGEVVEVSRDGIRLFDRDGKAKTPKVERVEWDAEAAAKGGYRHFMQKEIEEQPAVVARTLQRYLDPSGTALATGGLEPLAGALASCDRVSIVACGTSWHAGLVGKFLIEARTGVPVEVDYASEFRYRDAVLAKNHLVVAISQSGETLDTLAAIRDARERGAKVLSIVNVQGSSLTRESDATLLTDAGPEIGVASTKAFTTQLVALHLLALEIGRRRGTLDPLALRRAIDGLRALPLKMAECLAESSAVPEAAERFARAQDFLFLGRGINYPIALEGALKLKEISYVHAEGYPAGEMKHGPIALIDSKLPVVVIATRGKVHDKVLSNMQEVKARGGQVIAVAAADDVAVRKIADVVLPVPTVDEELSPLVNVLPLQRLAYWIADLRGCDIDKPRNLAKSVTVE